MNEEEKKAIEKFKFCGGNFVLDKESSKVVLNLIEKLQKENEKLKKLHIQDNKHLDFIMEHSISVQKIKDKIIELEENINKNNIERYLSEDVLEILQELIEEGE